MAFTNTGFKRSMKITITKTGNDDSVVETTYDGQGAFGVYSAIASDDTFRQLERNGVDGDWDVRLAAFKNYVLGEVGQDAYLQIDWDANIVVPIDEYDIKIMAIAGTSGTEIIAIAYKNGVLATVNDGLVVSFDIPMGPTIDLLISNNYYSNSYEMDPSFGTIDDILNPVVTPTETINGIYNVTIDTANEWDQ